MLRIWKYIYNTFLIETEGNYKKAYILASDHIAKLHQQMGIAEILAIYNYINPLWLIFETKYTAWLDAKAAYKSSTRITTFLLHQLSVTDSARWEATILSIYPKNSPGYARLMPQGRKPFIRFAYDLRIPALTSLANCIGAEAALQTIKAEIISFQGTLAAQRSSQQGYEITLRDASFELEAARIALMKGFYKNLGDLMAYYFETPETIQEYFDLSLIRQHINEEPTELFIGEVAAGTTDNVVICEQSFTADTKFIITNTGTIAFGITTIANPDDHSLPVYITISPAEQRRLFASELGTLNNKVLIIHNPDTTATVHYKVVAVSLPE